MILLSFPQDLKVTAVVMCPAAVQLKPVKVNLFSLLFVRYLTEVALLFFEWAELIGTLFAAFFRWFFESVSCSRIVSPV